MIQAAIKCTEPQIYALELQFFLVQSTQLNSFFYPTKRKKVVMKIGAANDIDPHNHVLLSTLFLNIRDFNVFFTLSNVFF